MPDKRTTQLFSSGNPHARLCVIETVCNNISQIKYGSFSQRLGNANMSLKNRIKNLKSWSTQLFFYLGLITQLYIFSKYIICYTSLQLGTGRCRFFDNLWRAFTVLVKPDIPEPIYHHYSGFQAEKIQAFCITPTLI